MILENFVEKFAEQFDETPADTITADTKFREIDEWSSMMALVIISMADSEYGLKLTGDDIRSSQTVNDLYLKLTSKTA